MLRLKTREVAPTIVSLQEQLEHVRAAEIERLRGKLGALTPQQEEAIEAITRGIINKIAHGPITELRRKAADPDGVHLMAYHPQAIPVGRRVELTVIVIGSRGSQLALWQARHIAARLAEAGRRRRASRSSRPPATRSPMCRWRRSAARGCSPRKSKKRCWRDDRSGGAQPEGHAHGAAGGPDAGGDSGARRSARRADRACRWRS